MLPRTARMRRPQDFRHAVRRGVRIGRPTVVVHAARAATDGVQVGFVVTKAVGNAVTRNRVRRRLRHLAQAQVVDTPAGTSVVVRALPVAADCPAEVARDLDSAWRKATKRLDRMATGATLPGTATPPGTS